MPYPGYYGKPNSLCEELCKHVPLISYTSCSNCSAGSTHAIRRETEKNTWFSYGLKF